MILFFFQGPSRWETNTTANYFLPGGAIQQNKIWFPERAQLAKGPYRAHLGKVARKSNHRDAILFSRRFTDKGVRTPFQQSVPLFQYLARPVMIKIFIGPQPLE